MNDATRISHGIALARISLGVIMLVHSLYLKAVIYTLPGTAQFFALIGLPAQLAYLVCAVEVMAGTALLLGWRTRLAALALVPILLGATWAHWSNGWLFTNANGGWEYPAYLAVLAMVQVLLGAGSWALDNRAADRHGWRQAALN